jgi:2-C-methyl-D-erythritol 4-phosphate cytidylyltransferase/2-C-methyl-D-erythritol 2,4-cyclodiphosphate synthase
MLSYTLAQIFSYEPNTPIYVAVNKEHSQWYEPLLQHPNIRIVFGGAHRHETVQAGLRQIVEHQSDSNSYVWIHDACRPEIPNEVVARLYEASQKGYRAIIPTIPLADTIKQAHQQNNASYPFSWTTLDRQHLRRAQTPQLFALQSFYNLCNVATIQLQTLPKEQQAALWSDEASIYERYGPKDEPWIEVTGSPSLQKITWPSDFPSSVSNQPSPSHLSFVQSMHSLPRPRIGMGFDIHRFEEQSSPHSTIWLGGVEIPHTHRIVAHSDGDVLLHALVDALLGAIGAGDIGDFFPPSDPKWKNVASSRFVEQALRQIHQEQGIIQNIDVTILAEAPHIGAHKEKMKQAIAKLVGLMPNQVNIKATTMEKLGTIGRKEGIAVSVAVQLLLPPITLNGIL